MLDLVKRCVLGGLIAAAAGCRTYEPMPIDWAKEGDVWLSCGAMSFDSLDEVVRTALIGNPELNRMRLKRMSSEKAAQATGLWNDPEVDFDLLRIVNPAENPYLGGASLAFTLPLSGVKGLERKSAAAYAEADAAEIVVAELETAGAARSAAVRLLASRKIAETLRGYESDQRISDAFAAADKLADAGEISRTEASLARMKRHQRLHRLREAEREADEAENSLRRILGVAPSVGLAFGDGCIRWDGEPARKFELTAVPTDYIRHPRVRAAVCRLEGGEAALEAEVRRQYPELKFGPAYSQEDGMDRLGIVAGLTLPWWNRNRRGIAEAEGVRDDDRMAAVQTWRDVVLEADAAERALRRLLDHPTESRVSAAEAKSLSDAGEMSVLEYLSVREESLDVELMEIEWYRDVRLAEENLRQYQPEVKE